MSTNLITDPSDWISQSEAARLRGVSRQAILKLVQKGRLRTLLIGGKVLVHRTDILEFEKMDAGRPLGGKSKGPEE